MPEFLQPGWLWLLLAAPGIFFLRLRGGVSEGRFKQIAGGLLRCLTLAALVVALAGPVGGSYALHTDVVFVLDVSHSVGRETVAEALDFINQTRAAKDPAARMGLVVFGADAALEVMPHRGAEPIRQISTHVERGGTDIERALEVAIGAFPSREQRRIVLLSDGQQNLGRARTVAAAARSIGVELLVIPLTQSRRRDEVRVQDLSMPTRVHTHEPFEVRMTLHSSSVGSAQLILLRNGAVLRQTELALTPGSNAFSLVEQVTRSGLYEYEAIINSDQDSAPENNRYQAFVQVTGAPRVLHAAGRPDRGRHLSDALRAQGLSVDEVAATAIPATLHQLSDYDLVILNNVSGFDLSLAKMELLESYVRDAGGGLVSLGGDRSYGAGGYHATPIERLLPVTMDLQSEVRIPSLAVVIVLDKSGSMVTQSQGEAKITIAKRAALAAVEVLNPLDKVGVLAFDAKPEWSVLPTEAMQRGVIAARLRQLRTGGGTQLFRALQEAHRVIDRQPAKIKHLIVLSDGLTETEADFDGLGRRIAADGITVSTVALGGDADQALMARIAAIGGGRYYYAKDPQNIPRIFISETLVVARDLVVEQDTQPALQYPGEMVAGFGPNAAAFPALGGYQRTFAKPAAQVVLAAPEGDPLLVSWRYGLGRSVAFMSDLSGRWGRRWLNWPEFSRFAGQLARWTMRRGGTESLVPSFRWQGRRGEILIDALDRDERFINGLALRATVVDPERNSRAVGLEQLAPGRYRGEFPLAGAGRYYVNLSGTAQDGTRIAPKTFGLAVPYSPEFVELGTDRELLRELAAAADGRLLPLGGASTAAITAAKPGVVGERWRVWWPLLLAALVGLLLEVMVRKISLPEAWRTRWRGWLARRRLKAESRPDYETLQADMARFREQQQTLRDTVGGQGGKAVARARFYLAGSRR